MPETDARAERRKLESRAAHRQGSLACEPRGRVPGDAEHTALAARHGHRHGAALHRAARALEAHDVEAGACGFALADPLVELAIARPVLRYDAFEDVEAGDRSEAVGL